MAEMVTLRLSDEVIRRAREVGERTGRPVEAVLAEWIDRGSSIEDISPLSPNTEYHIYTPFGNEAVAQILFEVLNG